MSEEGKNEIFRRNSVFGYVYEKKVLSKGYHDRITAPQNYVGCFSVFIFLYSIEGL